MPNFTQGGLLFMASGGIVTGMVSSGVSPGTGFPDTLKIVEKSTGDFRGTDQNRHFVVLLESAECPVGAAHDSGPTIDDDEFSVCGDHNGIVDNLYPFL